MLVTFNGLFEYVTPAVRAVAGRYKAYGFTPDDCLQEAASCILTVMARKGFGEASKFEAGVYDIRPCAPGREGGTLISSGGWPAYVKRCVLNCLAGIPRRNDEWGDAGAGASEPGVGRVDALVWADLLEGMPPDVRGYAQARVIDDLSWDDTCHKLGLSDRALSALRVEVGRWLLSQIEGRKSK